MSNNVQAATEKLTTAVTPFMHFSVAQKRG